MKFQVKPFIIICGFAFLAVCGCTFKEKEYGKFNEEELSAIPLAMRTQLPAASGGLTLSVVGETITVDEIIRPPAVIEALTPIAMAENASFESFRSQAKPFLARIVMGKVSDILIYHLAKKNAPSNIDSVLDKAVEKEVNNFVAIYGNDYAKAEKAFKEMGLVDWDGFRQYKKKLLITQSYVAKQLQKNLPIMHRDMVNRYNKDERYKWDGIFRFRVIDIQADKLSADKIDTANGETADKAALRIARQLKKRLNEGEDFASLAQAHSLGIGNNNGGLWHDVTQGSLASPYDAIEAAAATLEPTEISEPIVSGGHVFIVKLEEKTEGGSTPFKDVQDQIEAEIRLIQQRNEYNKVIADIIQQANVADMDTFTEHCLKRAYRIIKQ